ncbi:MAG: hypothetical protein Q7S92_05045 [Candidatus Diapherotrites archaeon]|nr:hypothetical protein [Candidatus Diapherotrites archaeon]
MSSGFVAQFYVSGNLSSEIISTKLLKVAQVLQESGFTLEKEKSLEYTFYCKENSYFMELFLFQANSVDSFKVIELSATLSSHLSLQFWNKLIDVVIKVYSVIQPEFGLGDAEEFFNDFRHPKTELGWLTFFNSKQVHSLGEQKFSQIPVWKSGEYELKFGEYFDKVSAGKMQLLPVWKCEKLSDGSYLLVLTEQFEGYPSLKELKQHLGL